jgi:hypothetical protein
VANSELDKEKSNLMSSEKEMNDMKDSIKKLNNTIKDLTQLLSPENLDLLEIASSPHMRHIDTIGCFDSPRGPRGPREALHRMQWVREGHLLQQSVTSSGTPTHTARVGCWASTLGHVFVGFSSPVLARVRLLLALLIDLHA